MKKIIICFIILSVVLISGCAKKGCPIVCKEIPFSETSPAITDTELEQGRYYGQLDQKKPGTPNDWIHGGEGTKSAAWFAPTENNLNSCDCNK